MPAFKNPLTAERWAKKSFGVSRSVALALNGGRPLNEMSSLAKAYLSQKHAAKRRGIDWCLAFDSWIEIWKASGHLSRRGVGRGSYCMARHGDTGPYSAENVSIIPSTDNSRDGLSSRFLGSRG